MEEEIKAYCATNAALVSSPCLLQEAHKCVVRGVLIKLGAKVKKDRQREVDCLLEHIGALEKQHKHKLSLARDVAIDLQNLRDSLNSLLLAEAKTKLMYSRRLFY